MPGFTNNALSSVAGANVADVALPASTNTTVFTTGTLAQGTWLCTFSALVNSATGGAAIELKAALGTATGSLTGEIAGQSLVGAANAYTTISMTFVATLTGAGTLTLVCNPSAAAIAHYNTNAQLFPGATAYACTRIA